MALAILEFVAINNKVATFRIDTGTNGYYYLKIGQTITERDSSRWVDDISSKTPLAKNDKGGSLLNSDKEISIPATSFTREECYVQLFSFKNSEGKSPAISKVIKVPVALNIDLPEKDQDIYSLSTSRNSYQMAASDLNPHRNIPHIEPAGGFSTQASNADLLSEIIRIAAPIVVGLVSGIAKNGDSNASANGTPKTEVPQVGMFNTLLDALLKGLAQTVNEAPLLSAPKSMATAAVDGNRFLSRKNNEYARPFIFGIDDAIIASVAAPILASVAGPLLQMVPQLLGADNPHKLQQEIADNKFVTDILSEGNRDALMKQFMDNQAQGNGTKNAAPSIDMNQLMKLLQQMPQQPANTVTVPGNSNPVAPPVSITKSLGQRQLVTVLSTNTILSFELAGAIMVDGKNQIVFNKNSRVVLKLKRNVADPNDKAALAKVIVKFCFKDKKHNVVLEKIFKLKDVQPGLVQDFEFSADEINKLPDNKLLQVYAEMKWLSSGNVEVKALGATELIFSSAYVLKEQGKGLPEEKEPMDMKAYRSFWNKVWESPVANKSNSKDDTATKYRWELDANLKYSMALTSKTDSNGLMDTKMLLAETDPESLTEKLEGKMKGGIEISISELNKMAALWNRPLLNEQQLSALKTPSLVHNNAGEFIYHLQLKGMAKERGLVWVVPVLKLYEFTLGKIGITNESGQVTGVEEEKVMFPLPVAARIVGLKTN